MTQLNRFAPGCNCCNCDIFRAPDWDVFAPLPAESEILPQGYLRLPAGQEISNELIPSGARYVEVTAEFWPDISPTYYEGSYYADYSESEIFQAFFCLPAGGTFSITREHIAISRAGCQPGYFMQPGFESYFSDDPCVEVVDVMTQRVIAMRMRIRKCADTDGYYYNDDARPRDYVSTVIYEFLTGTPEAPEIHHTYSWTAEHLDASDPLAPVNRVNISTGNGGPYSPSTIIRSVVVSGDPQFPYGEYYPPEGGKCRKPCGQPTTCNDPDRGCGCEAHEEPWQIRVVVKAQPSFNKTFYLIETQPEWYVIPAGGYLYYLDEYSSVPRLNFDYGHHSGFGNHTAYITEDPPPAWNMITEMHYNPVIDANETFTFPDPSSVMSAMSFTVSLSALDAQTHIFPAKRNVFPRAPCCYATQILHRPRYYGEIGNPGPTIVESGTYTFSDLVSTTWNRTTVWQTTMGAGASYTSPFESYLPAHSGFSALINTIVLSRQLVGQIGFWSRYGRHHAYNTHSIGRVFLNRRSHQQGVEAHCPMVVGDNLTALPGPVPSGLPWVVHNLGANFLIRDYENEVYFEPV